MSTKNAKDIARDLVDVLAKRVASTLPVITQAVDATGNPIITLSADATPAFGEKVVVIVVKPYVPGTATDVFGNAAQPFGPHVIQFCTEANYAADTDNVADLLTPVELLPIIAEIAKRGCVTEWHVTDNGTVPSAAAIAAGDKLKATYMSLFWGVQAAI